MALRYYVSSEEAPFFVNNKMGSSDRIPTSGTYKVGDFIISNTQANGVFGWVCTQAGTPGTWIEIGTGGSNTKTLSLSSSTVVSSPVREVAIGIKDFNKNTDFLMVYKNSTYLTEGVDYDISSDSTKIVSRTGNWNADSLGDYRFSFVVIKEVEKVNPEAIVGTENIKDNVVTMSKLGEDVIERLDGFDTQLEQNTKKSEILEDNAKKISGSEFLNMNGKDIADLLQDCIDNGKLINLPFKYRFTCSKPIMINSNVIIRGNNSYIKFTYEGERALFEQNNNGASLECYDLEVEISNDQIAYDFRLTNNTSGTHIRLFNCVLRGNENNTKGVLMKMNDFSCIKDTKFWYVNYPISCRTDQRDNTQIVFENIGINTCKVGVELEQSDKVSLINVDVANTDIGFKILGRNKRLKFLNCHVENYNDTGYMIVDNVNNDDIIFENCSLLLDKETSRQGFYAGRNAAYKTKGLKYINCHGNISNSRVFNILCPATLYGRIKENDVFTGHVDSYINTEIQKDEKSIIWENIEYVPSSSLFEGSYTFSDDGAFKTLNFNDKIYINHAFKDAGFYEITYNGYNNGENIIFCYLQENGGSWEKLFSNIRLNDEKVSQKIVIYVPQPKTYRIGFESYSKEVEMKLKNITVRNI